MANTNDLNEYAKLNPEVFPGQHGRDRQHGRVVNTVGWTKQLPDGRVESKLPSTAGSCVSTNMAHTKFYGFKVTAIKLNQCRKG
jgi:hypothetical protein